jgi:hypothetical protein
MYRAIEFQDGGFDMTVIRFSRLAVAAMIVTFGVRVATSDAAIRSPRTIQRTAVATKVPHKPWEIRMLNPQPEPPASVMKRVSKPGKPNWLGPARESPAVSVRV